MEGWNENCGKMELRKNQKGHRIQREEAEDSEFIVMNKTKIKYLFFFVIVDSN